jgi:hypothetical protein
MKIKYCVNVEHHACARYILRAYSTTYSYTTTQYVRILRNANSVLVSGTLYVRAQEQHDCTHTTVHAYQTMIWTVSAYELDLVAERRKCDKKNSERKNKLSLESKSMPALTDSHGIPPTSARNGPRETGSTGDGVLGGGRPRVCAVTRDPLVER